MRSILKVLAVAATLAAVGAHAPAVAQTMSIEAPSAEDLARASAEADALISGTGAPQLFENISGADGLAKVRHTASGLVCSFLPGAENNTLRIFDLGDDSPGDDVGCNADVGPAYLTYYATRYGPGYSAADSARDAVEAIRNRWPDARPYQGTMARVEPPTGVDEVEYAALLIGPADAPRYTHALTAKVGEWIFKQRMTGDGDEKSIMANQVVAGAFFNDVLRAAVGGGKP